MDVISTDMFLAEIGDGLKTEQCPRKHTSRLGLQNRMDLLVAHNTVYYSMFIIVITSITITMTLTLQVSSAKSKCIKDILSIAMCYV